MEGGSWKLISVSVLLAAAAGVGTAWFMVPRMEPPGGPAVSGPDLSLVGENRRLQEQVKDLQRQVAEARLEMAAMKAFPRGGKEGGPAPEDLRAADEISLRAALERASRSAPIDAAKREEVVRLLLEASGRMREIRERLAAAPSGDPAAAAEAEELGRETRRRLEEALDPPQLRALDEALGAPPPEGAPPPGKGAGGGAPGGGPAPAK